MGKIILTTAYLAFALILVCPVSAAEPGTPITPADKPEVIQAVQVNPAPKIDGLLDDHAWTVASKVTGFTYRGKVPRQETVAWFCCDSEKLYFAFDCKDTQPELIRAQQIKRNGNIWADDVVLVDLDCLHDHSSCYEFGVNARGTQYEYIPGGSAMKVEWRGDWRAAVKRYDGGWTAEIEIPFSILRYPRDQGTFGLALERNMPHDNEFARYPNMGENWQTEKMIDWTGIVTPAIKRSFVYMPFSMVELGEGAKVTTGLDIKRTFDNNVATAFTLHPDFKTIEQAVDSVDFSYNPRYLEDRRPFFTEGSSYFGDSTMLYPHSIGNIDMGGKVFGKVGVHRFGVLSMADMGDFSANYLSYRWEPNSRWSIGGNFFNYDGGGEDTRMAKLEANYGNQERRWSSGIGYRRSFDRTHEYGDGSFLNVYYSNWGARGRIGYAFGYDDISPDFSSPVGYLNETGWRAYWYNARFYDRFDSGPLLQYSLNWGGSHSWYYGGAEFECITSMSGSLSFRNNTYAYAGYYAQVRPPDINHTTNCSLGWRTHDLYRNGGIGYRWGRMGGADYRFLSFSQGFRLSGRLSAQLRSEHLRMDYLPDSGREDVSRDQIVGSMAYDITSERGVGLGCRLQDGDSNLFLTYRQQVRIGTDIFILWGNPNSLTSENRLSLKMVRVL